MVSHSVFISYASADRAIALRVCEMLEALDIPCWIAPRNVPPGMDYGQAIIDGIKNSRIMLVLLSEESGASRYVAREVERAVTHHVTLLPVRLANMEIPAQLEFFLGSCQWFDLLAPVSTRQLNILGDSVVRLLDPSVSAASEPVKHASTHGSQRPQRKRMIFFGIGFGVLTLASVIAFQVLRHPSPKPSALSETSITLTTPENGARCLGSTQLEWSENGLEIANLDGFEVEITPPGGTPVVNRTGIRYSFPLPQIAGEICWRVRPIYKDGKSGAWSEPRKFVRDQDVLSRILRTHELHLGHAESGNSFINGESGNLSGFDVELIKELVTRILHRRDPNAKLRFVPHASRWIRTGEDGKPERFLNLLKRDATVDVLGSGISITAERQREGLAFTKPVLTYPQTLITLKDVAAFVDGKPAFQRLGAVEGTTNIALARQFQKIAPELEVLPFIGSGAHEKMLKALFETREIDSCLADKPMALRKVKNFQGDGSDAEFNTVDILEVNDQAIPPEQIAFVIRPGDVEFKEALNREIADTLELRRDLVKKYFPTLNPATEVP
ncbi:MAG: TIR domain-containing protein [Gloeobacteraceae cyanobacterium ES-bin-144]|nr:TIR domain-containing protein [Verrucomicrobiales bacterium]